VHVATAESTRAQLWLRSHAIKSSMSATGAPDGMSWNAYRSWYSANVGRAGISVVAAAYKDYAGKVSKRSQPRGRSPPRAAPAALGARATASPKRGRSAPARKKSPSPEVEAAAVASGASRPVGKAAARIATATSSGGWLCSRLGEFAGTKYDMSSLICAQLARQVVSWADLLAELRRCVPAVDCDPCTSVGHRIARSLIRIAATRVFAEPAQSILEPIVNSVDAYNPTRKIGKFGLGEFSLFYWLIGHPLRSLRLSSAYEDASHGPCEYEVVIAEVNGLLTFELLDRVTAHRGIRSKGRTGVTLRIIAEDDPFTAQEVSDFSAQLSKLLYLDDVFLYAVTPAGTFTNQQQSSRKVVQVIIEPKLLSVSDYATGVSLEVLFGSLLVPSISTKTISLSQATRVAERARGVTVTQRDGDNHDKLLILVGGVGVVSLTGKEQNRLRYLIYLPGSTRVPVSRDDVLPGAETTAALREGVAQLLAEGKKTISVAPLQRLLEQYVAYTASPENRAAVRTELGEFFVRNRDRLVPEGHAGLYQLNWRHFVGSVRYDIAAIERWLDENTRPLTDAWYGVKALVLRAMPGRDITDGGLVSYLFVADSYRQKLGADWTRTIASSYFERKLYPVVSSYGAAEYEKYDLPITVLLPTSAAGRSELRRPSEIVTDPLALRLLFAVLLRLDALSTRFDFDAVARLILSASLVATYVYARFAYATICGELLSRMGKFVGNQTYGGTKYALTVASFYDDVRLDLASDAMPAGTPRSKVEDFFLQHVVAVIRAVKEQASTRLRVTNGGSLRTLYQYYAHVPRFFAEALRQSESMVELTNLLAGAGKTFATAKLSEHAQRLVPAFVQHVLERIRARQLEPDNLRYLYDLWDNGWVTTASLTLAALNEDDLLAREWLNTAQKTQELKIFAPRPPAEVTASLKLSKLVRYLFGHDAPVAADAPEGALTRFLVDAAAAPEERTPLQIIEIAVNEGTVKPALEATMTELTQNSIDAIREFRPHNNSVSIYVTRASDSSSLTFEIADLVGMTPQAFLYVGVPFLSTKTPSELVTGEMGSGFFNSYRESTSVIVSSVNYGMRRVSYDVPIRDERGRVVDIEKRYTIEPGDVNKASMPNGTRVTVTLPVKDELEYATLVARIEYTARYVLALSAAPRLNYLGKQINVPKQLCGEIGFFRIYETDPAKSVRHESYLLTKGVPFAPLLPFVKDMYTWLQTYVCGTNYVVDITHGGYTPVQTRTKIRLAPQVEQDFSAVAVVLMFLAALREFVVSYARNLLDHSLSTADARQLKFTTRVITRPQGETTPDFLKYVQLAGQPTVAVLINECIDIMGTRRYEEARAEVQKVLDAYKTPYALVNERVRAVARTWLSTKNANISAKEKEADEEHRRLASKGAALVEYESKPDGIMQPVVERWVSTYWQLAQAQKVVGYERPVPRASAVVSEMPASGWYAPGEHSISLNTRYAATRDRQQLAKVLSSGTLDDFETTLKQNALWNSGFAYSFPSSTMIHELEHARRGTSHEHSGHESTNAKLWPDDEAKTRTFDQAAAAVYERVLAASLLKLLLGAGRPKP
jgi:hypothetical protein